MFYFGSSVPPFCGPWWFFGRWLIQCVLSPFAFTQISCCYHHSSELPFDRYHHHSSLLNISFLAFPFQSKVQLTKAPMFTIWGRITSQRSAVTDSDKKWQTRCFDTIINLNWNNIIMNQQRCSSSSSYLSNYCKKWGTASLTKDHLTFWLRVHNIIKHGAMFKQQVT